MTLFADDNFGVAVNTLAFFLPLEMLFGPRLRLQAFVIIIFPIDEHHDIRILLDRARFSQVRKLRPLVFALFDSP